VLKKPVPLGLKTEGDFIWVAEANEFLICLVPSRLLANLTSFLVFRYKHSSGTAWGRIAVFLSSWSPLAGLGEKNQ
jgi:hypothetical protein